MVIDLAPPRAVDGPVNVVMLGLLLVDGDVLQSSLRPVRSA
jgi:hypothetical protein